jgi:Tfp pilus assembly PilM family ATPase
MRSSLKRHTGVGISLEDDRVEVVHARCSHGSIDVKAHEVIAFSRQIYETGRIYDLERFPVELKHAFDLHDIPRRGVTLTLPSSVAVLRMISMPRVNRKQMEGLLQFQLQDEIWLPIADPVYDFDYFPTSFQSKEPAEDGEGEGEALILLVAAPRDVINGLAKAFREAGIKLAAIEVKGLSILRGMKALGKFPDNGTIVADFTPEGVEVHFYRKGCLFMTRVLDIRADDYLPQTDESILKEPAATRFGTSPSGKIKWNLISDVEYEMGLDTLVRDLGYQLQRSISFVQYSLKQRDFAVDSLYLSGHVPNSEKLAAKINLQLDMDVKQLCAHSDHPFGQMKQVVNMSALGAALRGAVPDAD